MMQEYQSLNNAKWDCKYHVAWIPKYRKRALYGSIKKQLVPVIGELARHKEYSVINRDIGQVLLAQDSPMSRMIQKLLLFPAVGYFRLIMAFSVGFFRLMCRIQALYFQHYVVFSSYYGYGTNHANLIYMQFKKSNRRSKSTKKGGTPSNRE